MEGKAGGMGKGGCDMMGGRWRRHWEPFWEEERGEREVGGIRLRLCERGRGRGGGAFDAVFC